MRRSRVRKVVNWRSASAPLRKVRLEVSALSAACFCLVAGWGYRTPGPGPSVREPPQFTTDRFVDGGDTALRPWERGFRSLGKDSGGAGKAGRRSGGSLPDRVGFSVWDRSRSGYSSVSECQPRGRRLSGLGGCFAGSGPRRAG